MGREYPEEKQQELMTSGLGFGGMRERLRQLGGTWKYNPMEPEARLARFSKPRDHLVRSVERVAYTPFGIV
jgi:signal transduction histidine kinase